ncbi:allophanate hydrolase [Paraconexibacter algicola]|uniref:Allophanate hydrolase n=1 Tax=Paraconexibacter algicola TaxID=2133960 RepID=A0A2T4UM73_9ACTN|nr:allophanate hydrolase [Paraconexibacter algicola]PTL60357.1 allophanate hydrolase [Paraconexibacter algicola]
MIRVRPTDPQAAVAAALDRLEADGGPGPAWISVVPRAEALARAAAVDPTLPLAGVPFAVKDNLDVAGLVTTAGCPGFAYTATATAPAVQRLLDAGAVLVGKTNLDQFATGLVGTRSPYGAPRSALDDRFVSGGSSSGSAVAVADGTVPFALGTDTAGSGRVPAAFNGIVGLKPTRGLVPTRGVVPASRSLDCVSVFARTVGDARAVLDVVAGHDPADPWSRRGAGARGRRPGAGAAGPRLGVPVARQVLEELDPRLHDAWHDAVAHAGRLSAAPLVEVDLTPFLEAAALLYEGPWLAERWLALREPVERGVAGLDPVVAAVVRAGAQRSGTDVFAAVHRLAELRIAADAATADVDVLLLPTAPTVPTPAEVALEPVTVNRRLGRWTNGVNLLDRCALSVPAGLGRDGLPFGVTLVADAFAEDVLTAVGAAWCGEEHPDAGPEPQAGTVELAVVGAHLRGQPLEPQLQELGATFVREARTAPDYRLYALPGGPPLRPGLVREPGTTGPGIELEVVRISLEGVGALLTTIPAPLGLGTVVLDDGRAVAGFLCEAHAAAGARDITDFGGWRAYLASDYLSFSS